MHEMRRKRGTPMDQPVRPYKVVTSCAFKGCGRQAYRKGLCKGHLQQARAGKLLRPLRTRRIKLRRCATYGCDREAHAKGLCDSCYYHEYHYAPRRAKQKRGESNK